MMKALWLSAICLAAPTAWAQEDLPPQEAPSLQEESVPEVDDARTAHIPPIFGVRYALWAGDFQFEAETASDRIDVDLAALHGIDVAGRFELAASWDFETRGLFLLGPDTRAMVAYVGGRRWFDAGAHPWRFGLGAGLLIGTLDLEGAPGDFGLGFGLEASALANLSLEHWMRGLSVTAEVALRHLKFGFDEDDDVIESDDGIGGIGVAAAFGAEFRF